MAKPVVRLMIIFLQLINNFLGENFENVLDGAVVY
jgi:hypothetical protein